MIGSFSVEANDRAKREVALMIKSVRQFYDCPVYVMCDQATQVFLARLPLGDVRCILGLEPERLTSKEKLVRHIVKENEFHSASIILTKMDIIETAVKECGDTFFLDADIVVLKNLDEDIDTSMELILSPHFHVEDKIAQNKKYGCINAGYLWTRSSEFAQAWRDIYLTKSSFYEQQGMIYLLEPFDAFLFNRTHNLGFWRFPKKWKSGVLSLEEPYINWHGVKSVHLHCDTNTYSHADPGLQRGYDLLKEIIWPHIPIKIREFFQSI